MPLLTVNSFDMVGFPLTRRTSLHPTSRTMTEENFTRIFKTLVYNTDDKLCGSFILNTTTTDVEFFIGGYYFKVPTSTVMSLVTGSQNVYFGIRTQNATQSGYTDFKECVVDEDDALGTIKVLEYNIGAVDTSWDYSILLIKDGQFNQDLLFSNLFGSPFIISTTVPTDTSKLWINPNEGYSPSVYHNGQWNKMGAVYK